MKLNRNISCLLGSAVLASLALGGMVALGPLNRLAALSDLLLHGALLILFWLGYVTSMICSLCFVGDQFFGRLPERDPHRPLIED